MAQQDGRGRWAGLRDSIRTQLWPLPTLGIALALILGVALPELDRRADDTLPTWVTAYLFGGGPSAARTVLETIAGSLMTVTALTFSLTVVTLQLASSQFSPRLLRTFTRDRFVQATLALFLATFTYALTVLRTIRTEAEGQVLFVPQLSVSLAFLLTVASVVGLVLFLAHLAREIRVETMLATVEEDAQDTVRGLTGHGSKPGGPMPPAPPSAMFLPATESGFLVLINEDALLAAAREAQAIVVIDRTAGGSVVAGTPLGQAWPLTEGSFPLETLTRLRDRVSGAITLGFERTSVQDVGFGLRQLTDVAVKALSPGINDPTTAVHALGHTSALLCTLAGLDLSPVVLHDDGDEARAILRRPSFRELLDTAIAQPRRYGAADPAVLSRLFQLLAEVAWSTDDPECRRAVTDQLARLRASAAEQDYDPAERSVIAYRGEMVERALSGRWVSPDA